MEYLAKSRPYNGEPVTVSGHSIRCSGLAGDFGADIGIREYMAAEGLVHDFGKYGPLFRDVLYGLQTGVDHALPGAALLYLMRAPNALVQAAAGHHDGLLGIVELEPYLKKISCGNGVDVGPYGKRPSMSGNAEFTAAMGLLSEDLKRNASSLPSLAGAEWPLAHDGAWPEWKQVLFDMLTARMALSCQVDADYTVSAIESGDDVPCKAKGPDPAACLARLHAMHGAMAASNPATPDIRRMRELVWDACGDAGKRAGHGFLTLTAPTGSAKTMGMLRFALERMAADPSKRRVIFVLPYLSLIDQSVDAITRAIPGTVVDTSVFDYGDRTDRLLTETYDAPCVVTTTVQFFGSLFSDRPGDCRKLHNLAGSIIVFDEIQALPAEVSRLAMQDLRFLCDRYGACVLLSTATHPAYGVLPGLDWDAHEVIPDVDALFAMAPRKNLKILPEPMALEDVASRAAESRNACVVCNLRRHALAVYDSWKAAGVDGIYLLSADLCPEHRADAIREIRVRQAAGETVRVAATQSIEAGVDLDFETLYRAYAPLVSILQAMGRQDRNGLYPDGGTVVFEPLDETGRRLYPGVDYERQAMIVKELLAVGYDLRDLGTIRKYYRRLFAGKPEPDDLWSALMAEDYPGFARASRIIRNAGARVVVPYGPCVGLYEEILDAAVSRTATRSHLARSGRISVPVYDMGAVERHCVELLVGRGERRRRTGTYVLLDGHGDCYRSDGTGLRLGDDGVCTM